MNRPSAFWRLLVRVERYLPQPAVPATDRERAKRKWAATMALLPIWVISLAQLVRHRVDLAEMWPQWRGLFLGLTLVVAGATAAAVLIAGVVTWRREHRHRA